MFRPRSNVLQSATSPTWVFDPILVQKAHKVLNLCIGSIGSGVAAHDDAAGQGQVDKSRVSSTKMLNACSIGEPEAHDQRPRYSTARVGP